ncbi:MAG: DUF420 domain-containing protein [Halobacteria archaeon]
MSFPENHPGKTTAVLSVIGYAVVISSFAGLFPYPKIEPSTVNLLSDVIAAINAVALTALVAGYLKIRKGDVEAHKKLMLTSFGLILLFLVVYLFKVGGGGTKVFEGPETIKLYLYLPMLAVHLILSIVSVPVVLYAVVLGLTQPVEELGDTVHPRVGKIAVVAWVLSLALGLATYLLLNVVYTGTIERGAESLYLTPVIFLGF